MDPWDPDEMDDVEGRTRTREEPPTDAEVALFRSGRALSARQEALLEELGEVARRPPSTGAQ